jgi:hypothetical protein
VTAEGRLPRALSVALAILAVAACGAAVAWACTPSAFISVQGAGGQDFGPAGSQATVQGSGFSDGAKVQIRWNSADGPTLATATGPRFSVAVTIPANAADGVYYIVATAVDSEGNPRQAPAPFRVGEPTRSPGGGSGSGSDSGSGGSPAASAPAPTATPGGSGPAPGTGSGVTSGGNTVLGGRIKYIVSGAGPTRAHGGGLATLPSGQAVFAGSVAAPRQAVFAGSVAPGQAVFAGSVPQSGLRGAAAKRGSLGQSKTAPSQRSAGGDLWSGFSGGKGRTAGLDDAGAPSSGPGAGLYVGIGLVGVGLAALLAGFGVPELRRRRALARTSGGGTGSG